MKIRFKNSKQLKETRSFIKSLNYVNSSIEQKQKQIYLYVSEEYIAITNNIFNKDGVVNFKACVCKLKKNMYSLQGYDNQHSNRQIKQYIFYLDASMMSNVLNTQVQPDIQNMQLVFPDLHEANNNISSMILNFWTQSEVGRVKLFTRLQKYKWPFTQNQMFENLMQNSKMIQFLTFPSKFAKQIDNYKQFQNLWLCLNENGINIKKIDSGYIVCDQFIIKQKFGGYDYNYLNAQLQGNIFIRIPALSLFRHLETSNKQGKKTTARIIISYEDNEQNRIKQSFLYLSTQTQRKQINELLLISIYPNLDSYQGGGTANNLRKLPLRIRGVKKQQDAQNQRIILNKLYGPQYQQSNRRDNLVRQKMLLSQQPNEQDSIGSLNPRKFKVQMQ